MAEAQKDSQAPEEIIKPIPLKDDERVAVYNKIKDLAKELTDEVAKITDNEDGNLLIQQAIKENDLGVVKALLTYKGLRIAPMRPSGLTPAHLAFNLGKTDLIEPILRYADRTNYADEYGMTLFHVACAGGSVDQVSRYLDQGINPNLVHRNPHHNKLPVLMAKGTNRDKILATLISAGADPNYQETPPPKPETVDDEESETTGSGSSMEPSSASTSSATD